MFMRPAYLEGSTKAWVGHIPFAFWMIEALRPSAFVELGTHYGNSYFAFCQGVEKISINTCCYAVDTWQGDEHAGTYGEEVFNQVTRHNQGHYAGFSTLIRSSFDAAVHHFEDGSIDLLHIDGLHTYDAVRHDFESWLPKLSDRAVVLFHDTNVKNSNFGVGRYFHELSREYPSFEFYHSHGLGVLGVGSQQGDALSQLFSAWHNPFTTQSFHNIFSRLGQSCDDILMAQANRALIDEQQRTLDSYRKASEEKIKRDAHMGGELEEKVTASEDAKKARDQGLQEEASRVEELNKELERLQGVLKEEKGRATQDATMREQLTARISALEAELSADKERISQERESGLERLASVISSHNEEVLRLQGEFQQAKRDWEQSLQKKAAREEELTKENERLEGILEKEKVRATQDATRHEQLSERIAVLEQEKSELTEREAKNATTLHEKIGRIEELEWYLGEHKEVISNLGMELEKSLHQRDEETERRNREMEQLQGILEEERVRATQDAKERDQLTERISELVAELGADQERISQERESGAEKLAALIARHNEEAKRHEILAGRFRNLEAEKDTLGNQIQGMQSILAEKTSEIDEISQKYKKTESKLNDYIRESAIAANLIRDHALKIDKLTNSGLDAKSENVKLTALIRDHALKIDKLTKTEQDAQSENVKLTALIRDHTLKIDKLTKSEQDAHSKNVKLIALVESQGKEVNQLQELVEKGKNQSRLELKNHSEEKAILRSNLLLSHKEMRILQLRNKKLQERSPVRILKRLSKKEKQKQILRESGWFDEEWYLEHYPDVAESGIDPVTHYLSKGAGEKRNPSPFFDTQYYLENNPDILELGMNPLYHFIQIGIHKGIKTSPENITQSNGRTDA